MSLRTRLFLSYAAVIALTVTVAILALIVLLRDVPDQQRQSALLIRAADQADFGRLLPQNDQNPQRLRDRLVRFANLRRIRVLLTDTNGQVTLDTANQDAAVMLGKSIDLSERSTEVARPAAAGEARDNAATGEFRDGLNRRFLFGAVQRAGDESWLVIAQQSADRRLALSVLDDLSTSFLRAFLVALLISALLAAWMARSVAHPIRGMASLARAIAAGKLDQRVANDGPAEVRQLAADFNTMAERVQAAQQTEREFMANVTHELKTPLTSIQGFAQAIRDGDAPNPSHAAGIIYDESTRLQRLVNGLLDSARLESGAAIMARDRVDFGAIVHSCAERLASRAQSQGVQLRSEPASAGGLSVIGDGDWLLQVVTNLVDNALKHTAAGGKITLTCNREAAQIVLHVTDSGAGIGEKDLPHIFDRFYQADKSRSGGTGAGLGLSITRQIVETHGGTISAQSVKDIGTRITVRLPAAG
jgi:signal transduction histidine kinase